MDKADKLLSTGVSMDPDSQDYKTVMDQIHNVVVYSTIGNFVRKK